MYVSTNWFIAGKPASGKTTLIKMIIERLKKKDIKMGGFITPEERQHGIRTGFFVQDIETGERVKFADTNFFAPKIGKYGVNIRLFESIVLPIFDRLDNYDIVVIDQIGAIELRSSKFCDKLQELLESRKPVICTIENEELAEEYKVFGEIREVTYNNKPELEKEIYEQIIVNVSVEKMSRSVREGKETKVKQRVVDVARKAVERLEKEETKKIKVSVNTKIVNTKKKTVKKKTKKKITKRIGKN